MKHKRITFFAAALLLVTALSGCTLAKEDAEAVGSDRLIGAFITTKALDLFDMDAYLTDHAAQLATGGELAVTDTAKYQGRIYAEVGESVTFEGVQGVSLFAPLLTTENGAQYYAGEYGDGICDVKLICGVSDDGESIDLEGTIYVLPKIQDSGMMTFHVNPVYQTAAGDIYLMGSVGYAMEGTSEGEALTSILNETSTMTDDNGASAFTTTVTVHISVAYTPTKITLYQMDGDNQILRTDEFVPGHLPETLTAESGTAYILIETEKLSPAGEVSVSRELFEKTDTGEDSITTLYPQDNGTLTTQYTEVIWP